MINNKVIAEKPFQNSGIIRALAILNRRPSSIHPSSFILESAKNIEFQSSVFQRQSTEYVHQAL